MYVLHYANIALSGSGRARPQRQQDFKPFDSKVINSQVKSQICNLYWGCHLSGAFKAPAMLGVISAASVRTSEGGGGQIFTLWTLTLDRDGGFTQSLSPCASAPIHTCIHLTLRSDITAGGSGIWGQLKGEKPKKYSRCL